MTILGVFLNKELRTGGHIRCLELMEGLAQKGHVVTVLLNDALEYQPKSFSAVKLSAPYRRRGLPRASAVFRRASAALIRARGLTAEPQIVIAFGETHFGAAEAVGKAFGASVILGYQSNSVQEALISIKENAFLPHRVVRAVLSLLIFRIYEIRIARSCNALVFQSAYDRDDFLGRNRAAIGKSFVIGGNIGLPRFTAATRGLNASESLRKILFMGALGERKGLRYLLQAFKILRSEGHDGIQLHVAGPGSRQERGSYERYCARHGLTGSVTFHGRVSDTFPLMAECDIVVVPSLFDSYPDVILLALHAGIPVVGSRVGGIPEMLMHPDLLFPPRNGPAIASILRRYLNEPSRYAELRALSSARCERFHFDWPAAWENVAAEVLAR